MFLTFLVVGAPFCTLWAMVGTDWGRGRIRDLVVQVVRDELGLALALEGLDVEASGLRPQVLITVRGISIDDPEHGPLVRANELRIRPSLWALAQGRVDLRSIEIDQPSVHLVVRDGQVRNLPHLPEGSGGPVDLPFRELRIRGARVGVDAAPLASGVVHGVDIDLIVAGGQRMALRIWGGEGHVDHAKGREVVEHLSAMGRVDLSKGTDVRDVEVRTPHVQVRIHEAHVPLPSIEGLRGRVSLDADLAHLADLPVAFDLPVEGKLHAEGRIEHLPGGVRAEGRVVLEHAALDGYGFGDRVTLDVQLDEEQVRIEKGVFEVHRGGGVVTASGTVGLGDGLPLDVRVGIDGLEFDRLMDQLGVSERAIVSWHFDGEARVTGTLDPLRLDGPIEVETRDFLVSQGPWDELPRSPVVEVSRASVRGRVSVTGEALSFLDLVAHTPRSKLRADVRLGFADGFMVTGEAPKLDLADVGHVAGFAVGGTGTARVQVGGAYADPQLTGHLAIGQFAFHGYPFGDVESDARMEKDAMAVRFPSIAVKKRSSEYRVDDLLLDFSSGRFEASAHVQARKLALADLYHTFNHAGDERLEVYQGTVRGPIDVHYTLGFPGDSPSGTMRIDMDLEVPELQVSDYAFRDGRLAAQWRWLDMSRGLDGGELHLEHLTARKGRGTVAAQGHMGLDGVLRMSAVADDILLRDTEGIGDRLPQLGGAYGLVADIRGTAEVPLVHMDLHLTGLSYAGALLGDVRTYVRLTDTTDPWVVEAAEAEASGLPCARAREGLARADWPADPPLRTADGPRPALLRPMAYLVCGEGLDGRLRMDVAMGRTEAVPLRGVVEVDDLPLAPFVPETAQGELTGSLSGAVTLTGGGLKTPESLVGRLLLSHLALTSQDVTLQNRGDVDVVVDRGAFRIVQGRFDGPGSRLAVAGGGSMDSGLALRLSGAVDLALVASLTPRVRQASGGVTLRMNVTGDPMDPSVYGEARVHDASFHFASFHQPVHDLSGRVTFSAHRVLFEDFHARVAGGRVGMSGAATLHDGWVERYAFDVGVQDISLAPEEGLEIGAGADLRLTWAKGERLPMLRGTVRLDRVSYTRPINLSPTIGELYRPRRAEVERYDPGGDQIALDVRVLDSGPLRIANNMVDARIRIEDSERPFRIVGTDQRIGALGTLAVERGVFRLRNTDFNIRRGVIDFDDASRIDPHFDVKAVTDIRRMDDLTAPAWRITLHAHGNSDAFQLDARSDQALTQEDVLMLLTVGLTRAEAEQLQAGDLASGAALEALSSVTGVGQEVQSRLKVVDDVRITSMYSVRTNRTEPQISIGKRIADRVRLSAATGLAPEARELRTSLEWQLGRQTSVQAAYDNVNHNNTTGSSIGNVGVDLRWRLEFE
jgi:translocation and assembly module TamB